MVKAYGGAQQARAVVFDMYSSRTCCAAAVTASWMKKKMFKMQQPQIITPVTIQAVQMLCLHMCTAISPNMCLVVIQYKQKTALLLQLSAVKAVCPHVAMQIPKRLYTLEELRLNNLRPEEFLSPEDSTLNTVRTTLQVMCITIRCSAFHLCQICAITAVVQQHPDHLCS